MSRAPRLVLLGVVAALCALAIVRWSVRPMQCNAAISELTSKWLSTEQTASDYERLVRARRSLAELRRIEERCSMHVNVHMLIAANEKVLGRREEALKSYRTALAVAGERAEVREAEGEMLIELGRVEEGVRSYVLAARYNPNLISYISPDIALRVEAELQRK